jgi:hypothetical protein
MKLVILESPYGSDDPAVIAKNVRYARACMRDCLINHNESPYASHLLYTQQGVLKDGDPEERKLGIAAGLAWGAKAEITVVYTDRGITKGMREGIERAREERRPIEYRELEEWMVRVCPALLEQCPHKCSSEQADECQKIADGE